MSLRKLGPCLVCGQAAVSINFAVPTCAPCKAFFRRNAVKLGRVDFICPDDGDCPVTCESRRICNCCRLAKCFRVGMQKSLIRTAGERESRKELVQQNREKRVQLLKIQSSGSIRPSSLLRSGNNQLRCLSPSDQTLLSNIFSAYERTYIITRNSCCQYFPSGEYSTIHTLHNEYHDRHMSLIEFFKLIPEFNRISINDKIRLIRNHFGTMYIINESPNQPIKDDTFLLRLKNVFGIQLAMNLFRCIQLVQTYEHDPILLKLILIIQSLSSGLSRYRFDTDMDHIYDDTLAIFAGQNVYVELLWRYILSRLPSERDAVKFFSKLILDLFFMLRVIFMIDSFIFSFPDEIAQMEPLMQSMWPASKKTMETQNNNLE